MDANPAVTEEGSTLGRMFNVLPAPGEVFQQIKERPVNHANWVLPALIWTIVGVVAVWLMFSSESFRYEIRKQQEKQIQMQIEKGKIPRDQGEAFIANPPSWMMTIAKVSAMIATGIMAVCVPFFWGLIIWFLASVVYKADVEYMKGVEAAGLASIIYVLTTLLASLLSIAMGKMTFLSPAYFIENFDMTNRNHMIVAALNPFYLWYAAVVAVSISVLANVSVWRPLAWCLVIWIAFRALALSNPYTMNFVL
jgi:hypothetical protein